ncbi:MAG TPA: hypothetical protein PLR65_14495, partial [Anaerolineales bacterium]|nr:hypothetical protein [Anaerolineales bacterium]
TKPAPANRCGFDVSIADFLYDGDGKRVKSVMNMSNGSTTTYFVGSHYEVANGVITKYYYAGTQRIALRTKSPLEGASYE